MQPLITPAEAVASAFSDGEYIAPEAIGASDLLAAEARYLQPVAGERLCAALRAGSYPELLADYVLPALAACTRLLVQPRLDVRCGSAGTVVPASATLEPAGDRRAAALHKALRMRAQTLLRRLAGHLDGCAGRYPEYDPDANILNRCSIYGNLVQTP